MRKLVFAAIAAVVLVCPAVFGQAQPQPSNIPNMAHVMRGAITTATCTADPDTGCVEIPAEADGSVGIEVTGAWVATLQFEGTKDRSTYFAVSAYPQAGGAPITSTTANGSWLVAASGIIKVRVRASAFTSGTVTVGLNAGPIPFSPVQFAATAANLAATTGNNAALAAPPGQWSVNHSPASNTAAVASKAAGAAGVRHIISCVSFGIVPVAAQASMTFNLRDGAAGAGTILWSWNVIGQAGVAVPPVSLCGLNIPGSAATAMTLESQTPAVSNFAFANISGYDAN